METLLVLGMILGLCVSLLAGFPVAFTLSGVALLFALLGGALDLFDFALLGAFPQRIFGIMTNSILIAVPLFILMGTILERAKISENLLHALGKSFGHLPGGLGISVICVGALLAASTGIVGATVVTMGLLSLPVMLKHGYAPPLACGLITASGTLGQIIPPSIVLILLGDVMSNAYQHAQLEQGIFAPDTVSVGELFAGALLPGLLLVCLYITYQGWRAFRDPTSAPALPPEHPNPSRADIMHVLVAPVVLILVVLGSILAGIATPTESAALGAIGAILLAGSQDPSARSAAHAAGGATIGLLLATLMEFKPAWTSLWEKAACVVVLALCAIILFGIAKSLLALYRGGILTQALQKTASITAMVFAILIGASLFSIVFRGLGGDSLVHTALNALPGGNMGILLTVMLITFLLGFFLDFVEIIFIVIPLVAPPLITLGMDPVWLGVLIALNLQTSFLTPPFGFALFYLRGVAPSHVATSQIYTGTLPFISLQLLTLILIILLPELATWLPEKIFG